MLFNKEKVLEFLPHRSPFLFIDSIESITSEVENPSNVRELIGTQVIAHYKVKKDHVIFDGHFPGNPILPGVVQIEMMAQASAFASIPVLEKGVENYDVETLLLGSDNSKYRKPIIPGMDLKIISTVVKCRGNIASYNCEVFHEDEKTSESQVLAKLTFKEK
ncbi:MAG: hypothetical protein N4A33_12595 [Bacteriovoracaceae bacterium]|jgi:3-hydroxyacyl-[acyl-carrier-protein] dehydratase|nr:hypothetical protein [Bacteriovoracaceae bacterium]